MISLFSGLLAGLLHVFSGPDHLAAVAPLSVRGGGKSWRAGMKWGLGHASGVLLVGLFSLAFTELLPVELLSSWAERLVGVVLIGIGLWGFRKALAGHVHAHEHAHDGHTHIHIHLHAHGHAAEHAHTHSKPHRHSHAAFGIGTLHGLAGSSHFLGVLPALAFQSRAQAVGYLAAYGLGSIVAMTAFSFAVGGLARGFCLGGEKAYRALMCACSLAALGVGTYWLFQ